MVSNLEKPRRVIYNFVARCNMACSFCYVPFDARAVDPVKAREVLQRILVWDIESLVIGGGDPLMYSYSSDLVAMARNTKPDIFIQVDTNALATPFERFVAILGHADVIGLPVDGLDPQVCFSMRRRATHGHEMLALTARLVRVGHAVKINTVVSRLNLSELNAIGHAVEKSGAKVWSLYQFWPIGPIAKLNRDMHHVSNSDFDGAVQQQLRERTSALTGWF